jgi:hypothetical protein
MRGKYLAYSIIITLVCSLVNWSGLAHRATGGQGSGNSWHSWSSGPGYTGGGWGGSGGHK